MFRVSPASLQTFIDMPNWILQDLVQYSTVHIPNVFYDGHLQIIMWWLFSVLCTVIIRCTETFWSSCICCMYSLIEGDQQCAGQEHNQQKILTEWFNIQEWTCTGLSANLPLDCTINIISGLLCGNWTSGILFSEWLLHVAQCMCQYNLCCELRSWLSFMDFFYVLCHV
jgi:hypothetical protein